MTQTKAVKLDKGQTISHTRGKQEHKNISKATSSKIGKKRKAKSDNIDQGGDNQAIGGSDSDSGSDVDFIDVDLDFYSFIESDYQAIKHLLTQLLSHDAKDLDVAGLANHIIEEDEEVGSAVKSDGEKGDPLAFISVLPWSSDLPHIAVLRQYILDKTSKAAALHKTLADKSKKIGIVLQERLVNMPVQVIPPLLRSWDAELSEALPKFQFTHLVFVSRVFLAGAGDFQEDVEMADSDQASSDLKKTKTKAKKAKKGAINASAYSQLMDSVSNESFLYHAEDEVIAEVAGSDMMFEYPYSNAPKRGEMADGEDFGVEMRGRVTLIDRRKVFEICDKVEKLLVA